MNPDAPIIPAGGFQTILADPPWAFAVRSPKGEGRSASQHYGTMNLQQIKDLPVGDWAAENCALFLWATDPMLPQALETMAAWGFTYKTVGFYWAKQNLKGDGFFTGMGYWSRANCEMCLLGTRGSPKRLAKDVRRLIVAPRREHSRKPDETHASIGRLVPGPYLEMFAREAKSGWTAWGNQTDKFHEPESCHPKILSAPDGPRTLTHEKIVSAVDMVFNKRYASSSAPS